MLGTPYLLAAGRPRPFFLSKRPRDCLSSAEVSKTIAFVLGQKGGLKRKKRRLCSLPVETRKRLFSLFAGTAKGRQKFCRPQAAKHRSTGRFLAGETRLLPQSADAHRGIPASNFFISFCEGKEPAQRPTPPEPGSMPPTGLHCRLPGFAHFPGHFP